MALSDLNEVLKKFRPIGLNEMDCVELMNRTDFKYIFSAAHLAEILDKATDYYKVLEINNLREFVYSTTYLDTDDYSFFKHHMTGKLNRYKVRYRVYESTGGSYLEIKHKSNKLRTTKWRIQNNMQERQFDVHAANFLEEHLDNKTRLNPVLINKFNRITLVGQEFTERITLDFNLQFSDLAGKQVSLPYLGIAEIKCETFSYQSPFVKILKDMKIRQSSFSKYCVGVVLLQNNMRKNALKSKLMTLEKIKDDYILYTSV